MLLHGKEMVPGSLQRANVTNAIQLGSRVDVNHGLVTETIGRFVGSEEGKSCHVDRGLTRNRRRNLLVPRMKVRNKILTSPSQTFRSIAAMTVGDRFLRRKSPRSATSSVSVLIRASAVEMDVDIANVEDREWKE